MRNPLANHENECDFRNYVGVASNDNYTNDTPNDVDTFELIEIGDSEPKEVGNYSLCAATFARIKAKRPDSNLVKNLVIRLKK